LLWRKLRMVEVVEGLRMLRVEVVEG